MLSPLCLCRPYSLPPYCRQRVVLSFNVFVLAVDVNTRGVFRAGVPKQLFKTPPGVLFYDVSADGKRFLMPAPLVTSADASFTAVLNGQSALKKFVAQASRHSSNLGAAHDELLDR